MARLVKLSFVLLSLIVVGCNRQQQAQPQQQPPAAAQQPAVPQSPAWLQRIPQKNADDYTFADFKDAFEAQARLTPAPQESVTPVTAAGPDDPASKRLSEEENLYRRWEWFTQPRVFPTGRWDNEKVFNELQRVAAADTALVATTAKTTRMADPESLLKKWKWTPLGPSDAVGGTNLGRVNAIAFDPANPKMLYIGAADGGVWRSKDSGSTWTPLTDALPTLSIGDIAVDPKNPNTIYVATGDAFGYGNPFWGGTYSIGVWKSTNGGATWSPTGLTTQVGQTRTIRRLALNPANPMTLMAATSAGLFRTTDGGATWSTLWNNSTFDVEFNALDGKTVYATTDKVQKSSDGGCDVLAAHRDVRRHSLQYRDRQVESQHSLHAVHERYCAEIHRRRRDVEPGYRFGRLAVRLLRQRPGGVARRSERRDRGRLQHEEDDQRRYQLVERARGRPRGQSRRAVRARVEHDDSLR